MHKSSCIECHREYVESTAFDPMYCDKFCEKTWHDRNYVPPPDDGFINTGGGAFKPYYSESHNIQVNSWKEEAAMKKKYGGNLGDFPERMKRSAYNRKHKEDIIAEKYAKIGLKYPKGQQVNFDEKNGRFVPRAR